MIKTQYNKRYPQKNLHLNTLGEIPKISHMGEESKDITFST